MQKATTRQPLRTRPVSSRNSDLGSIIQTSLAERPELQKRGAARLPDCQCDTGNPRIASTIQQAFQLERFAGPEGGLCPRLRFQRLLFIVSFANFELHYPCMSTSKPSKQSRVSIWILGIFVLLSLTVLILLQTSNLWKDFTVETASDTLLLYALSSLNFIAFVIFGFIFLRSITKLMRERRTLQLGSKIKTRLLLYFAAVSLLPIIAMAGFSYLFMNRALERWFTQFPEQVVIEAREAQTQALADQNKRLQESSRMIALTLDGRSISDHDLNAIASAGQLSRIEILSPENQTLGVSARSLAPEQQ